MSIPDDNAPGGATSAKTRLFGIDLDQSDLSSATTTALNWMETQTRPCRMIVTPNVNHAVLYQDNGKFREAYRAASLTLADGRYLGLISRWLGLGSLPTVNGSDLVPSIFRACSTAQRRRVYLLGAGPGVAASAAERIDAEFDGINVIGTYSPPIGFESDQAECGRILAKINALQPDLVIVGISPPRQEIWVAEQLDQLDASVVICAGATIDFLAGHKRRAPEWIQRLRMEWLHRTLTEPARLIPRYTHDAYHLLPMIWREWRNKDRS